MALKGNAIIGQSGGPTAAINATLSGVIRGALACSDIDHIYGAINGVEGMLADRICDLRARCGTEEALHLLERTPAAALGSCRLKLPDPSSDDPRWDTLFGFFEKYNIRYFFYIGGNDSMDTVAKVTRAAASRGYEMRVAGVPKTIDNDVVGTDHTPGFGSAAKYIAVSMQEILRDCAVYTVPAVTIVEIMGRDAGWLTAAAALTRGTGMEADLICLPERAFDHDAFFARLRAALADHPNVVVAVSEGLRCPDGSYLGASTQSGAADVFGHQYLAGTGKALERMIKAEIGCKVRAVELNILQRCASHVASAVDLAESVMVGRAAVEAAAAGQSGMMMTFRRAEEAPYRVTVESGNIAEIANRVRTVPDAFITADGMQITDTCVEYLRPLILGEVDQEYRDGLPLHFSLK